MKCVAVQELKLYRVLKTRMHTGILEGGVFNDIYIACVLVHHSRGW